MDFKEQLKGELKKKNLSDSSITLYLRNLERLNNNKPLKSLSFLSKIDDIKSRLDEYKDNTKRNFLISIVSSLSVCKDNKTCERLYKKYYELMNDLSKQLREKPTEQKSESQDKNWIEWEDIKKIYNDLASQIPTDKKELTEREYEALLKCVILSLYIELPPRRNQDYAKMIIVKTVSDKMPKEYNYFDYDKKQFVFNVYKTSKKYGSQIVNIPDKLMEALTLYLKYHPIIRGKINKNTNTYFLVKYDKTPLDKINSITRVLNSIFKKNIGSSMLRHIYLSGKYDGVLDEQKKDAELMGHSPDQQREYIKTDAITPSSENIKISIEKEAPVKPPKRARKKTE